MTDLTVKATPSGVYTVTMPSGHVVRTRTRSPLVLVAEGTDRHGEEYAFVAQRSKSEQTLRAAARRARDRGVTSQFTIVDLIGQRIVKEGI
jgi:hypothetical protein